MWLHDHTAGLRVENGNRGGATDQRMARAGVIIANAGALSSGNMDSDDAGTLNSEW
jgi:hypothetical protein